MRRLLLGLVVGLAFAGGPAPSHAAAGMDSFANKMLVRDVYAAFEKGDVTILNRVFDPDGPLHMNADTTVKKGGPFTNLKDACAMCAALAQRHIKVDVVLTDGNLIAVRSTWSGLFTGEFHGMHVVGKPVNISYLNIYRIEGSRIRESWASMDRFALADELGINLVSVRKPQH
jgi:predicted ester cyclase